MWVKMLPDDLKAQRVLTPEGLNVLILPPLCHQPLASGIPQDWKGNRKCFCLPEALQSLFFSVLCWPFFDNKVCIEKNSLWKRG